MRGDSMKVLCTLAPHAPPGKYKKGVWREFNVWGWSERSVHPCTLCTPWKIQKCFVEKSMHGDGMKGLCTLAPHAPSQNRQ